MRELADADRIRRFMQRLGAEARGETTCFLAGGATAVLLGWRPTTLDVDIRLEPDRDELLRALPRLKDELELNVELASPADFIPLPKGWADRSPLAAREGAITFRHFDAYSQALSKIERSHEQDIRDVETMLDRGLVDPPLLRRYFDEIEPELYRFPAIDAADFRRSLEAALGSQMG
jgi:hypothetical protein